MNRTVLLVDDDRQVLNSLRRLLRKEDYRLLIAGSGEEGLDLLRTNEVHVILSDQKMPGMTGIEFLQKSKEISRTPVRVVLSGYADLSVIVDAINKGEIYRFMGKPWNDDELKATIRQCIERFDVIARNKDLLHQVKLQSEKLKQLKVELAETVEIRTRALQVMQEVLEKLPVAVVCISSDEEVMIVNESASEILPGFSFFMPGSPVAGMVPPELASEIRTWMNQDSHGTHESEIIWNDTGFRVRFIPLGDRNLRRGIMLTFEPQTEETRCRNKLNV